MSELLTEIKECLGSVDFSRIQINREMRERLLPVLRELKKRTFRKEPNYYEALAKIGLNGDTVRQWFYRSQPVDDAIDLLEEEEPEPSIKQGQHGRAAENMLLEHGDRMAQALVDGKIFYAKELAVQWIAARSGNYTGSTSAA